MVVHGPGGECLDANAAGLDALGLTRSEFLTRKIVDPRWDTYCANGRQLAPILCPGGVALRSGVEASGRIGLTHLLSGKRRWLDVVATPVDDRSRRVVYVQFDVITP